MNKPEKTKGRHIQVPCPDGKPGCLVMHFSKELFITDEDRGYNKGLEAGLAYHKSVLDRLPGKKEFGKFLDGISFFQDDDKDKYYMLTAEDLAKFVQEAVKE